MPEDLNNKPQIDKKLSMTDVKAENDDLLQNRLMEVGSVQRDEADRDQFQSADKLPGLQNDSTANLAKQYMTSDQRVFEKGSLQLEHLSPNSS